MLFRSTRYKEPPVFVMDETLLFALIRASFNQRRKTLVNGLVNSQEITYTKEQIQAALEAQNLSLSIRGEMLSLQQFAELSNLLVKMIKKESK